MPKLHLSANRNNGSTPIVGIMLVNIANYAVLLVENNITSVDRLHTAVAATCVFLAVNRPASHGEV